VLDLESEGTCRQGRRGEVFEKLRPATWLRLKIANFYAYSYFYCRNVHRVPYLVRDKRINTANCE
jgi:hypothetical protein